MGTTAEYHTCISNDLRNDDLDFLYETANPKLLRSALEPLAPSHQVKVGMMRRWSCKNGDLSMRIYVLEQIPGAVGKESWSSDYDKTTHREARGMTLWSLSWNITWDPDVVPFRDWGSGRYLDGYSKDESSPVKLW